jgi:hypothetical protein
MDEMIVKDDYRGLGEEGNRRVEDARAGNG